MYKDGKLTKDNFYDEIIKRFTKNVRSDSGIRFWERFVEYAYDKLFNYKPNNNGQPEWTNDLSLRKGDIFYIEKVEPTSSYMVNLPFRICKLIVDNSNNPMYKCRHQYLIYNDYVYDYNFNNLATMTKPEDIIDAIESGSERPYAIVIDDDSKYYECKVL
jgi:hypothetical protein